MTLEMLGGGKITGQGPPVTPQAENVSGLQKGSSVGTWLPEPNLNLRGLTRLKSTVNQEFG